MVIPALAAVFFLVRPGMANSISGLRRKPLVAIAALLQLVQQEGWWPQNVPLTVERRVYAVTIVFIACWFCWSNRQLAGSTAGRLAVTLIPLGTALNGLPIVVLGAMVYRPQSAVTAGYSGPEAYGTIPGYVHLNEVSPLWLPVSDFIPVPYLEKVLSVGDLALFAGLFLLIVGLFDQRSLCESRITGNFLHNSSDGSFNENQE
ncbi:MAG: DUF5317 family protein [Nocardioides sp.]|uniref:DUF5317 family protein n=1 Tax=Nocardioides sp. TaxID=35761 RepID=UPI0039E65ABC